MEILGLVGVDGVVHLMSKDFVLRAEVVKKPCASPTGPGWTGGRLVGEVALGLGGLLTFPELKAHHP
ncbi:hypothetical protein YIM730264_19950 [Thermus hydrothermalis]